VRFIDSLSKFKSRGIGLWPPPLYQAEPRALTMVFVGGVKIIYATIHAVFFNIRGFHLQFLNHRLTHKIF